LPKRRVSLSVKIAGSAIVYPPQVAQAEESIMLQ